MKEIAAGHFLHHCDENDMGGMDDGRSCRIPVVKDADAWEWKINGVSEYECFGMLPYAG